jgi:predicted O-linked N-acetylglucosamine transferase (SPINDLY family)
MSYPGYDHHRQGIALSNAGRHLESLASYDAALALSPQEAAIHYSRAAALFMLGRLEDALAGYDRCLQLQPGMVMAHFARANPLHGLQRLTEAVASLDRALALKPDMAQAWNNRSAMLLALGRLEEALDSIGQVLRLQPREDSAHYNAGIMLIGLSRYEEAQRAFENALALNPAHPSALGYLGTAVLCGCNWNRLAELMPHLLAAVRQGRAVVPPVTFLALCDDPALQRMCAQSNLAVVLAQASVPPSPPPKWKAERYRHDRIRIAYMSSDLRGHPVGAQIVGLLERHDRTRFEVTGIFLGRDDDSETHRRIRQACDHFPDVGDKGDEAVADLIRAREIDILVDLNGQTLGWRPGILKYRPAPVQAFYLGYAGTTGAPFIDYVVADAVTAPFDHQPCYSERIVHLPDCFWPSDPRPVPPPAATRAEAGLPESGFVFCNFNAHWKLTGEIFAAWMRLLAAVPGSVLWLRQANDGTTRNLQRAAQGHGVDPARIVWAPRLPSFDQHLARHALADLFLDNFPYNAHVTASDALWAGLPVLTLQGRSFVSRVASSFLAALDLPELVTTSLGDYEALALALARDPARLAALRARLAENRLSKPLFDTERLRKNLEQAFTVMVERSRAGMAPETFAVDGA